jgi:predicted XRE-type DNA-binding protein
MSVPDFPEFFLDLETMTDPIPVHDSSGNVFADLEIEEPEEYLAKSELAAHILRIVRKRCLTQAEAGKLLGITQPKVSDLLRGRLDGFSTDRLLRFITRLGYDVQIKLSKARGHTQGRMEVMA